MSDASYFDAQRTIEDPEADPEDVEAAEAHLGNMEAHWEDMRDRAAQDREPEW